MPYQYSKKINTHKNSLHRRHRHRHRMIDHDSYTVDPYQEESHQDTPPNFLQDLHSWVSNLGSKIHNNIKDMQKYQSPQKPQFDTEFANSGMQWNTPVPSPVPSHEHITAQLKNIHWALEHFPYQGPETTPQQLFVHSETGPHIQIFNITRSQHAYMLALYDANVDALLMTKLVLLLGERQAEQYRIKRTKSATSMRSL